MNSLPRGKPGDELTWDFINKLIDAIERDSRLSVDASSGIEMTTVGGLRSLRLSDRAQTRIAVLSGSLAAAATSTAPTSADAVLYAFDGTTLASTGVTIKVFNYHDKGFPSGSMVVIARVDGEWFAIDIRSCVGLT